MAYIKIIYQNSPSTATPINAENLNHMDDQIALNDQRLTDLEGAHVSSFNGRTGAVTPADGDYDIGQIAPLTGAQVGQVPVVTNIGTEEDPELVFRMGAGGGGGGGHVIVDQDGNELTQEPKMQFLDSFLTNDSINGRTVVENVKEVASADYSSETEDGMYLITDGEGAVIEPASDDVEEVTGDGNKTMATLLTSLFGNADLTKINRDSKITISNASGITSEYILTKNTTSVILFENINVDSNSPYVNILVIAYASNTGHWTSYSSGGYTPLDSVQVADGDVITLYYGNKKATVDLQTTANRCWYSDGETSVADAVKIVEGIVPAVSTQGFVDLPTGFTVNNTAIISVMGYLSGSAYNMLTRGDFSCDILNTNKLVIWHTTESLFEGQTIKIMLRKMI